MKILYLGNKLSKRGYTPTSVETLGQRLSNNYEIVTGSSWRNPIVRLIDMIIMVIIHRKAKYLLIDTYSTWGFWYAIVSSQLARIFQLKYIPILHGGNLPSRIGTSPYWLRLLLNKARHVVCPSGYLLEHMKEFVPREYALIPNYIDIENYPFKVRKVENPIRLLWVRAFHKIYNPKLGIDIVEGLLKKGFIVELAMVGPDKDGSMREVVTYAREKKVLDCVNFTGRLSKDEWTQLAQEYDIFINTTNVDNTPVSVMEAMALGMVVISTNVGGVPYLFENRKEGIQVMPGDAEQFRREIVELWNDKELASRLSSAARVKALEWDWNTVEKKWISLLGNE